MRILDRQSKHVVLALMVALTGLAGCSSAPAGDDDPVDPSPAPGAWPQTPDGTVRFLLFGDTGLGNDAQKQVAQTAAGVCAERGCQFAIITGDLVYPDGVRSAYDPQFEQKFETPFLPLDIPFYVVLGNHDNGNGAGSNPRVGDYMIDYSERTDRMTDNWVMPARHYMQRVGDVEFFLFDSGPQEVAQDPVWQPGSRGETLRAWFESKIAPSDASWKITVSHHPYISNGQHGDAGAYDNVASRGLPYKRMFDEVVCPEADFHFAGHDHDLQWLPAVAACPGMEQIVSGAGSQTRTAGQPPQNPVYFEQYSTLGFFWIEISGEDFKGIVYKADGEILFERSFTRT